MQTSRNFFKFVECLELVLKGLITYYNETLTVFFETYKIQNPYLSYLYFYSWFYKFYSVSLKAMFHELRGIHRKTSVWRDTTYKSSFNKNKFHENSME